MFDEIPQIQWTNAGNYDKLTLKFSEGAKTREFHLTILVMNKVKVKFTLKTAHSLGPIFFWIKKGLTEAPWGAHGH